MLAHHIKGPHIDWAALSPFIVLTVGALVVLLVGLLSGKVARERVVPALTLLTLAAAIGDGDLALPAPRRRSSPARCGSMTSR